eukprot:m.178926 g.178926  ORF g.178926 m.178926 type:complete len:258 (+) comp14652_c0_seq1:328-1101(+)
MPTILLVGDSIIDNHHWFDPPVGTDCTGDELQRLARRDKSQRVRVLNHAVEETRAIEWYDDKGNVDMDAAKEPHPVYVDSARRMGVRSLYPLDSHGQVPFFPTVSEDSSNLLVVVSAIGNDLFLGMEWGKLLFHPGALVRRLDGIFRAYKQRYPGCTIAYVFPYRPEHLFCINTTAWYSKWLMDSLVSRMKRKVTQLDSCDRLIDLSLEFEPGVHFDDPGTGIPEPTREGALHLAKLIYAQVSVQPEVSNEATAKQL